MTQPPPDPGSEVSNRGEEGGGNGGFSVSMTLKPILLAVAILIIPTITVAYTSPIVVPMLFSMSRNHSIDMGWRRAGLVGAGLVVIETALYILSVIGGS